jgi:rhodanese-related sulfurtransferase
MRAEVIKAVQNGLAKLLDVRTLEEWNEGHAVGALHIPLDDLLAGKVEEIPKNTRIYTYCRSGGRAGKAENYLVEHGYQAESIGGLDDWIEYSGKVST